MSLESSPLFPPPSELCAASAVELARMLRERKVSAVEALEAHLARIAEVDPQLNAVPTLIAERAREDARRADEEAARGELRGPLHGLPVAHKDLADTKGIRTTYGSPLFRNHTPARSSLFIERIQQAGAISIGKTNVPEFGAGSQTFNPVFGATRNPYDLTKTCGGSSGGAAAALATGMIPLADGSDTGGSLRNPAAFCGVVGFRPSPGRVPNAPTMAAWDALPVAGPMGRTVADTALLLSAMAGPDARVPMSIEEPGERFALPLGRDFRGVRVAWCANLFGLPFDRRVVAVFERQRRVFEALGCVVEDAEPDLTDADLVFKTFRALGFASKLAELVRKYPAQIKATVIEEVERAATLTGLEIVRAEAARSRLHARVAEFFDSYDYFVLPTTQVPAFDVEMEWVREIEGTAFTSYIDWMKSCWYVTVTALPAVSVPAGMTPEGLPVGLQIVGGVRRDFETLQLAAAFEEAAG